MQLFEIVREIVSVIMALVTIVERPGAGEEKRSQVVDLFMGWAGEHLDLPAWAEKIFLRESFVGWLVDVVVAVANMFGFFERSTQPETTSGA